MHAEKQECSMTHEFADLIKRDLPLFFNGRLLIKGVQYDLSILTIIK